MTEWDKLIAPSKPPKILVVDNTSKTENTLAAWSKIIEQSGKRNNLKPTHDPYTNPNAQIYYECKCGAILDPGTKSFAALNGVASDKGWKIRFGADGYTPYCVKCGEGVE